MTTDALLIIIPLCTLSVVLMLRVMVFRIFN